MNLLHHLPILPILIPLFAGALMLLFNDSRRRARTVIAVVSTLAQLVTALVLLAMAGGYITPAWTGEIATYALGNWPTPFAIVLVLDRLSAIMLSLSAILGLACLVYSLAGWKQAGVQFLPLFQFLLVGLNGAFLTGDLFNLFVFFEILLAASYGLALHGSGGLRVKAGLHYIAINLLASLLFLIAAAVIYAVTGTLNLADLANHLPQLNPDDRTIFDLGAGLIGIVFLVKAGAWPLNFWLPATYGAAAPPVAALFAIMTKVGIYTLLRFESLFSIAHAPAPFGGDWLFYCGLMTMVAGTLGLLASQQLPRLAGHCILISSGTLLAAIGLDSDTMTAPALFYLVSSALTGAAFFMLIELAERNRVISADVLAVSFEALRLEDTRLDTEKTEEVVGVAIPAAMAFLGMSFVCCALLLTGLPPLSGFIAKFSLIATALRSATDITSAVTSNETWLLIAALLLAGLAGIITLTRIGIRVFWSTERTTPRLQVLEAGPVAALILLCLLLTAAAGPAMRYFNATANTLRIPSLYIDAVLPAVNGYSKSAQP